MKYKVGDKVRIKSIDWYNKNKNEDGDVLTEPQVFVDKMADFCDNEAVITKVLEKNAGYCVDIDKGWWCWVDEMFEGISSKSMKQREVEIILENENVKLPVYATKGSSGMDVHAYITEGRVVLNPGERMLIHTGIKVNLPDDCEIQVRPRSGLALKHGVTVLNSPGTCDSDFLHEIGVILINHGDEPFVINNGDRIAQLVLVENVVQAKLKIVDSFKREVDRISGFGSTGV